MARRVFWLPAVNKVMDIGNRISFRSIAMGLLFLLWVLLAGTMAHAQENDVPPSNATEESNSVDSAESSFQFSADQTSVNLNEGREYTLLSGNAFVESGDIHLTAEKIELYGESFRYISCIGSVRFVDKKNGMELEAQELFFDRNTESADAMGSIVLDDQENNLVARANSVEIRNNAAQVLFKIGVRIVQDDLFVRSELVVYNRTTEELRLEGFPSVIWGNDSYRALAMTINLNSEEVELIGRVSGSIVTDDDSSPRGASNTVEDTTPAPATQEPSGEEEVDAAPDG